MDDRPALLRCTDGFLLPNRQVVKSGQLVPADHPLVKGRERHFEPAESGVELATRAPGEIRITSRRPDAVIAKTDKPARKTSGRKAT